ncbi:MAG: aspartate aminotransferase family protein [Chthoniobacteraceae bacterium]|nr:aspartate aminotransferase family protein [Chthoniobacteraceae bacterium]
MESTLELYEQNVIPSYGRFPLVLERGEGSRVWDETGKEYLDFGAGIAVCSVGHCHPRVAEAISRQARKLVHCSNLYYNRPQGELARRLVGYAGHPGKVFFGNSGAEANDGLYNLARKYGNEARSPLSRHAAGERLEYAPNRFEVITFDGSFHGRTLGGIAATGQEKVKKGFEPIPVGFPHVPFNDVPELVRAIGPETVAILMEPIQGEIGVLPATRAFLKAVRALCDEHGLLLMFDEVQCGLGRTGDWCAWQTLTGGEIIPDAISWAKGIAGGFPMGAFWVRDRKIALKNGGEISLADLLGPGSHGSTFGGTPLACTVANEVLTIIEDEGLLANAREMGAYAKSAVEALGSPLIRAVRGVGLMMAIELIPDFSARLGDTRPASQALIARLHAAGLLCIPSGAQSIRWLPPLNVTRAEIDRAVEILRNALT